MASALPLFRTIGHQLLIVALVILSLPIVISILWKLRLFPLGCYFVATKLFWPRWAEAHRTVRTLYFGDVKSLKTMKFLPFVTRHMKPRYA